MKPHSLHEYLRAVLEIRLFDVITGEPDIDKATATKEPDFFQQPIACCKETSLQGVLNRVLLSLKISRLRLNALAS